MHNKYRVCMNRNLLQTPVGVAAGEEPGRLAVLLLGRGDTADVQMLGLASGDEPAWAAADVLRGQAPLCLGSGVCASGRVRLQTLRLWTNIGIPYGVCPSPGCLKRAAWSHAPVCASGRVRLLF